MAVTPATKLTPVPTSLVPNPLNLFSSYTYSISFWWLNTNDHQQLQTISDDVDAVLAWEPTPGLSFCLAEDSGLYPDRRLPLPYGLNYNITQLDWDTTVSGGADIKSQHGAGTLRILEADGFTFLDSMLIASALNDSTIGTKSSHAMQPYMIQIDFQGYDDSGMQITTANSLMPLRKRLIVQITGIDTSVTTQGSEYTVKFISQPLKAMHTEYNAMPKEMTIVAGTVNEFFNGPNGLGAQLNKHYADQVTQLKQQYQDGYFFNIDPSIANSSIVNPNSTPVTVANPDNNSSVDLTKVRMTFGTKDTISSIINTVLCHSGFFLDTQLGLYGASAASSAMGPPSQTDTFNAFKVVPKLEFGTVINGKPVRLNTLDELRGQYPHIITYNIRQYPIYGSIKHPTLPYFADGDPHVLKAYNYIYTGENTDIIKFDLRYNTTFYTNWLAYTQNIPSNSATATTSTAQLLASAPDALITPTSLAVFNPQLAALSSIKVPGPFRVKPITDDQRITATGNATNNAAAQKLLDAMHSRYADMITVDLHIIGDTTLIQQEGWLFTPSASANSKYNDVSLSQSDFATKYGFVRFISGESPVTLTIKSPFDIDTDWNNTGLTYPDVSQFQSGWSGQYYILTIHHSFQNGAFTQKLKLVKNITDVQSKAAKDSSNNSAVRTGASNQSQSNSPNAGGSNSTPTITASQANNYSQQITQFQAVLNNPASTQSQITQAQNIINNAKNQLALYNNSSR